MDERKLPKGRLGRLARLAGAGARTAGSLLRSKDAAISATKTAAALGQLRGLATKVGQMASYVDGVIPEQHRDSYEKGMATLRAATPTSSPESIRQAIEQELGSVDAHFAEFDWTPIASASIGQVHTARLHDGRRVAVKVQHPGIVEAMESDLGNAGLIELALSAVGMRRFESKRMLTEIRQRFREELDYTLEAERQRAFIRIHAGDPEIHIPAVIGACSTRSVLTSELASGLDFDSACAAPPADRSAWCETLWRFVYKANLVGGVFNADPHPGNYLFQPDGRVTFLDFGCVQPIEGARRRCAARMHDAAHRGDRGAFHQAAREMLHLRGGRYEEAALGYVDGCFRTLFESPFHITRAYSTGLVDAFKEMIMEFRKGSGDDFVPLPPGILFINRLQFGFYSVLARLDAEADYRGVEQGFIQDALARED